jgi:hypothetical protein
MGAMHRATVVGLLLAAGVGAGCAPPQTLARADAEGLQARAEIPVAWVRSGRPWVDCPTNEGQKTWEMPARAPAPGAPPVQRAALTTAVPVVPATGGTWESYQEQWTRPLATPPLDPALATARAFLDRGRKDPAPLPLSATPVELESADPGTLARRMAGAPALVFQTIRFNLLGCYFTYQPWFITRATLVDTSTGRVIWRAECDRSDYRAEWPPFSTRDDLLARGSERYLWFIEQRAERCAQELTEALARARAAAVPPPAAPPPAR